MIIHFIDSTVFCNILNIAYMNDEHDKTIEELKRIISNNEKEKIVMPFATIIETGNHIAQIRDGDLRYKAAKNFKEAILKTIRNEAPWSYYGLQLSEEDLEKICDRFPEAALYLKMGIGDLSIVQAYERYKEETPGIGKIRIWTYDHHLESYKAELKVPERRRR